MPAATKAKTVTVNIPQLDQSFTLKKTMNSWALQRTMDSDDPSAVTRFMLDLIVDEDQGRFDKAMRDDPDMSNEKLLEVFMEMFKAVSDERPTTRSPGSSRTTPKKVVSRRSAAN